jgi:hypothetical protein
MMVADGVCISGARGGYELQADFSTPVERELNLEFGSFLLYIAIFEE